MHRDVAIKVPRIDKQQSKELLQLYLEEARAVAQLDHPAIVPIYDVGNTVEFPCFVVSKLIEGMDLKSRLNQ